MERGVRHRFRPLRSEQRWSARRNQCLACIKVLVQLPKLFGDYMFGSHVFDNHPRDGWDYLKLLQLNVWAAIATTIGGICLYEFSTQQLVLAMNRSAIFPLYLPHAIGLALACKFQGSVLLGNFSGYYFSRIYLVLRGPPEFYLTRALMLIFIALLGALETHIAAWLLHRYLCLREDLAKRVPTIDNVQQAFCYIVIVLGTTLLFDTPIAVVSCLSDIVQWHSFARFWITWWLGVVAGMLTLSPAIIHLLAIGTPTFVLKPPNFLNLVKSIALWVVVVVALILLFFFKLQHFVRPLPYLVFPLIVFASFRFNHFGWAIVVAIISLCCALGTLHRNNSLYYMAGAPADKSSPSLILQIELFVSVMGLVAIVLAAAVKEKTQLTDSLNKANEDLEETVATRTSELVKANNDLRISQKRAELASHAKSDFLANMSHEIRTPIHGILGLTALLLDSQLTADQRESLMSVKECADLLLHIINSVLDLSKIEAGRLEVETVPFSIRKTVSSTLRMMEAQAHAHNLQLLWHIDGTVPDRVVGDPGKLQQCILNLVGNALKFTNEGSVTVHVSLSARKVRQKKREREDAQSVAVPKVEGPQLFPRPPKPPSKLAKLRSWGSWPGAYFRADSGKSQSCTIDVHESSDSDGSHHASTTKVAPVPVPEAEICSQPSTPETLDVEFEVHDTGIGISKEKLQDMFNPFTQADASTSRLYGDVNKTHGDPPVQSEPVGMDDLHVNRTVKSQERQMQDNPASVILYSIISGVLLKHNRPLSQSNTRFVELLGGTIWAESEVNKGSTFGFRVPFSLSSDPNFTYKPQHNRGPPRFSSLEAPTSHGPKNGLPKNGLPRRAYSLDVLMRNMKFNLPFVVEGKDGEESVSSKGSGTIDSRVSSIQRTTTEDLGSIVTDKLHKFEKSYVRSTSSEEKCLKPSEESPTDGLAFRTHSTVINVGDRTEGTTGQQLEKNSSIEVPRLDNSSTSESSGAISPLVESSQQLDRSVPPNSRVLTSLPVESSQQLDTGVPPNSRLLTSPAVELSQQQDTSVPPNSRVLTSPAVESSQQQDTSVPPNTRVLASASKADSAKGMRKPGLERGERALHILLAEDNPINQKVATRQLQRYGHKVSIVGDGKQALDAVELNHDGYDLVLMDVQMPNMDGLQATQMIRELETQKNWSRLPILGLTAHAIQGYQETCLSHGMDRYLGKPFEIKQLLEHMHELASTNRGPRDNG